MKTAWIVIMVVLIGATSAYAQGIPLDLGRYENYGSEVNSYAEQHGCGIYRAHAFPPYHDVHKIRLLICSCESSSSLRALHTARHMLT